MANLQLKSANKIYPSGSLALYDINLETKDKEFLVILGGEGSGKSTLIRTIAGLEDLTSGEITIGGKNVTEADPKKRDVAVVFRNGNLNANASVYDNLAYGLKIRRASESVIDRRVRSAANVLGLTEVLNRKPKVLTAAQRLRVSIGRAVVREPDLYLFDEPLAGLDEKLQKELLNLIINMQARMEGSFIYATGNAAEALTVGKRIAIIKNGIIQQIDTPLNLYDYPVNSYVAFMIGSPTINFYNNAKIVGNEEGAFVEEGSFKLKLSDKIIKRFEKLEEYLNSDKAVIAGIRPEDISKDGNADPDRLYLFDGETHLTLLARDLGYVDTGFAEASYVPPSFKEEEQIIKKHKPAAQKKK